MLAAAFAALSAPALAQENAASEALFTKGVADMESGKFDTGCPSIAESYRLDPRPGTMFTLAECEAKWGKVASAVSHYSDYLGLVSHMPTPEKTRHRDRASTAEAQVKKLKPTVPQLTVTLPANAPKDSTVKRDGIVLKSVSLGTPLPVDPGEHVIVTQVPGGPEHEQKLSIATGESKQVVVEIELPKDAAAAPPGPTAAPTASPPPGAPKAPPASGMRTWAYVAGGIGLAGIVVGSVTGIMSMGKKKTVDDNCDGTVCNQTGLSASDDGRMLGNVSTVGFAVGAAGLVTGIVLLITSPSPKKETARWTPSLVVGSHGATAGLQGAW
jgi:hypothetical protein